MRTVLERLHTTPSRRHGRRWLRSVIRSIGPGFHFDTPPETYCGPGGFRLLSELDCQSVASGLLRVECLLGTAQFEALCLSWVHRELGWRYDRLRDELVPIGMSRQ